ncbi:MAG: TIGR02452 family protein [Bacteroidia bacterium]
MEHNKIKYNSTLDEKVKNAQIRQAKRDKLVNIFEVTKAYCLANKKTELKTKKHSANSVRLIGTNKTTLVSVINKDCVEVANELSLSGKTCMLNMANAVNRGGGVERGAMAQEEELCRRSNLWYGLRPSYYPMINDEFIYTKNVKFFRDKYYAFMNEFKCDILTIAAPCLIGFPKGKYPKNYSSNVEKSIRTILSFPYHCGVKHLVLSAFGCGAFRNNPVFISRIFKKIIKEYPCYESITFAILDDNNCIANGTSNFQTFKKTFEN